jgi:hypothetical protein
MATRPRIQQIEALPKPDPMALPFPTLLSRETRSLKKTSKNLGSWQKSIDAFRVTLCNQGSPVSLDISDSNFEPREALDLLCKLVYSDMRFFNSFTPIPGVPKTDDPKQKVLTHLGSLISE